MKYSVITFGCRVNQADSLGFEEELRATGAVAVPPDAADLVVVNTCSVTASADQGARQTIRRVARNNPGARIVVTGCCSTRRPAEMAALPAAWRDRVAPAMAREFFDTHFHPDRKASIRSTRLESARRICTGASMPRFDNARSRTAQH